MPWPDTRERLSYVGCVFVFCILAMIYDKPQLLASAPFTGFVGTIIGATIGASFGYYFGSSKGGSEAAAKMTDAITTAAAKNTGDGASDG